MDSLTHIVLGAVVGEALGNKQVGRGAMFSGAILQLVPDLDVVAALWLTPAANLMVHRGITHSIIFALLFSFFAASLMRYVFRKKKEPFSFWLMFCLAQLGLHIFIDAFNVYGAGWFEPFSKEKISFNTLYVADPILLIPVLVAAVGLMLTRNQVYRNRFVYLALSVCSLYLLTTIANKRLAGEKIRERLAYQQIEYERLLVTPSPFNSLLWYAIAENRGGYYIGYSSVFDHSRDLPFQFFPQQQHLLGAVKDRYALHDLLRFSKGYYTLEQKKDTLIFNDLRFGQIAGWQNPQAKFVFHYFLDGERSGNMMVMQRGRIEGWNRNTIDTFLTRIKGR